MKYILILIWTFSAYSFSNEFINLPNSLNLLHHEDGKSLIVNDDFFLTGSMGRVSPSYEWEQTIIAFEKERNLSLTPDEDLRCRYPARWLWLKKNNYFIDSTFDVNTCTGFVQWSKLNKLDSLSVMYATGYLGNPASYYGHLLLKMNYESQSNNVYDLLDHSVNFGALIPEKDNTLVYIIKGIIGAYDSQFTFIDFFHHQHNYGENELRDMWEYKLNISHDQSVFLLAHLWELRSAKFKYVFAKENCAYQLGRILELVSDDKIVESKLPWSMPYHIVDNLIKNEMVETIDYIPSKITDLNSKFSQLNKDQKKIVKKIINKPNNTSQLIESLPVESAKKVIEFMLNYWQVLEIDQKKNLYKNKIHAIKARLSLPKGKFDWGNEVLETPPHESENPSMVSVGAVMGEDTNWMSFKFRPAYYDRLSKNISKPDFSTLQMMDFDIHVNKNQLYLNHFKFVNIESFSFKPRLKGLPGNTWKVNFGVKQDEGCGYCLQAFGEYGRGIAKKITDNSFGWLMLDVNLTLPSEEYFKVTSQYAVSFPVFKNMQTEIVAQHEMNNAHDFEPEFSVFINSRLTINSEVDARFASNLLEKKFEASIGYYF